MGSGAKWRHCSQRTATGTAQSAAPAIEAKVAADRAGARNRTAPHSFPLERHHPRNGTDAEARSNWLVVRASDGGPILGAAGTYRDDLVKQGDAWLIRRRRITHDIDGDLGLLPTRS